MSLNSPQSESQSAGDAHPPGKRKLLDIGRRLLEQHRAKKKAQENLRRLYVEAKRDCGLTTEELELEIIKYRETVGCKARISRERVYFLLFPDKGLIKIGVTRNLKARVTSLAGAANKTNLVGTIEGDGVSERVIHYQFRQHRQHGEFFSWVPISEQVRSMVARNSALLREHLQ